jgi:hypothetical protein
VPLGSYVSEAFCSQVVEVAPDGRLPHAEALGEGGDVGTAASLQ